jgi:hypothetical protein
LLSATRYGHSEALQVEHRRSRHRRIARSAWADLPANAPQAPVSAWRTTGVSLLDEYRARSLVSVPDDARRLVLQNFDLGADRLTIEAKARVGGGGSKHGEELVFNDLDRHVQVVPASK